MSGSPPVAPAPDADPGSETYAGAVFSRRSAFPATLNRFTQALEAARSAGRPLLDLTCSNPTRAGFVYGPEVLTALGRPESLVYAADSQGLPVARAAIAAGMGVHGAAHSPDDILLTPSTSDAYSYLFKLLCNPGDNVLAPRPSYPLLEHLSALDGIELRPYAIRYDGRYYIDVPALRGQQTPRTRAIIAVSPNNPTGSFLHPEEATQLAALGLPLIVDEVFAPYRFAHEPAGAALLDLPDVPVFTLHGLSKAAALPQLKAAWIALGGAAAARAEARRRLGFIADSYLSTSTPVQHGLAALLQAAEPMRERILRRVQQNLKHLQHALGPDAPITVRHVEGGWYATVQLPRVRSEEAWALALLAREDLVVQPGYFYDFEEDGILVLSLLPPAPTFQEGVLRLGRLVRRLA